MDNNSNPELALTIVEFGVTDLIFWPIIILEIDTIIESVWVLKLSHLQVQHLEMCHPRVYGSICS